MNVPSRLEYSLISYVIEFIHHEGHENDEVQNLNYPIPT